MKAFTLPGLTFLLWAGKAVSETYDTIPDAELLEVADFVPLSCNAVFSTCVPWSKTFGTGATQVARVVVKCGACITMDHPGPTLTLQNGLDIQGKLVFPDNYKLQIQSPLIVVQGELQMQASKPVDGVPSIRFIVTGSSDQFFTPIGSNANACGGSCNVGKKSITVAGGKVNRK